MNAAVTAFVQHFHWLRPYWLCLLIPALLVTWLLYRRERTRNAWQQLIAPELLMPLLQGEINTPRKMFPLLALLAWFLFAIALAGPSWEKLPTPVEKHDTALVILMDLSPSMLASDVKPSRLVAARRKILDLLKLRKEGYTALIGYSGDAHVVAPLTDDTQTIANLLNVLEPAIMPSYGSNVEDALGQALQLFQNSGYTQGDILLVTDGITAEAQQNVANILADKPFALSIIGVGTETGAPIPDAHNGFLKDSQGNIVMPQLHASQLAALANSVHGHYSALQLDDSDIAALAAGNRLFAQGKTRKSEREFDAWRDRGAVLCLALLPLLLAAFRRGVLVGIVFALCLVHTPAPEAADIHHAPTTAVAHNAPAPKTDTWWDKLWLNDDQRAMKAMRGKNFADAAQHFHNPDWKAAAQYEQGDYGAALKQFTQDNSDKGLYNQGNALAKSGNLEGALKAYQSALAKNPQLADAAFNKKIVEDLLKQQKKLPQEQQKPSQDKSKQSSSDSSQQEHQDQGKPEKQADTAQPQSGHDKSSQEQQQPSNQNQSSSQEAKKDAENAQKNQDAQSDQNHQAQSPADTPQDKQAASAKPDHDQHDTTKTGTPTNDNAPMTPEQKQALDQWLRQVPDDPSALLRNKFQYYYQQRLQDEQEGKTSKHLNDEERW